MILSRIFEGNKSGFYVDVGAHHPTLYSNTYFFYKIGWRGVNIDAMPGSMKIFNRIRPNDINIEAALSDRNEKLIYCAFEEPLLNGFINELAMQREAAEGKKILFKKEIETRTLAQILDENLPYGQNIDFLSIDVEGFDFKVLQSNNWQKYSPKIIIIEILNFDFTQMNRYEVYSYLHSLGYKLISKTLNNLILIKS